MPDSHLALRQLPFPPVASALGLDVAKYQRKGKDYAGPCPIHQGKNANSFRYEVEGGRWHCFSCNAKGRGSIDLTIAVKAINFSSAVELLTPLVTTVAPQQKEPPRGDSEATDGVLKPYTGKYEKYKVACPWLEKRIPDAGVRERYGVFCYNNPARKSAYSGRVMIPVKDVEGVLYGYLGRAVTTAREAGGNHTDSNIAKYLFPKNLPKSQFLFGAAELKAGMFGSLPLKRVYLLESPFAVMKFASMGLPAVSPFGWSISSEQLAILQELCRGLVYLPDRNKSEEAGRTLHQLCRHLWLRFPQLPAGIDDPEKMSQSQILSL